MHLLMMEMNLARSSKTLTTTGAPLTDLPEEFSDQAASIVSIVSQRGTPPTSTTAAAILRTRKTLKPIICARAHPNASKESSTLKINQ